MSASVLRKNLWVICAGLSLPLATWAAPILAPADDSFYTPPAVSAGNHGDLIWYRPTTINLGGGVPPVQAWNVMYRSTDSLGASNFVTGTIVVPTGGTTARSVVAYAVGTHGLAQNCSPSKQLAAGTDYEAANIAAAIKAGYAVLISDYAGYTTGGTPTYMSGKSQGNALLDLVLAATQIPNVGISSTSKVGIWGYSQGGQTATWAGEQKASYAPNINLVGVAAGGVPADLMKTAFYLDGSAGSSFLLGAVIGLATQYPSQIPLADLTNANGTTAINRAKSECVFESLFDFMNHKVSEYTVNNQTLTQLTTIPSIKQTITAQSVGSTKIPVPLYQYHGVADEFIPLDQSLALKRAYCNKFGNVTFDAYPSEHIVTQFQAAPTVLSWLTDRFAGKSTLGTCLTLAKTPVASANPAGGNFVVSLKNWPLSGTINLKTLAQSVTLPTGSTLTANADITAKTLKGTLSVPALTTTLKIAGLPADVKLEVTPAAETTGTAILDNAGILHVHGQSPVNIRIVSAGVSVLQIPFGCKTSQPVILNVDFDGPVSSLGNGNFSFTGTTTFPPMKDCGVFNSLFTSLMSGPGQTYSFNVKPPAPVKW